MSRIAYVNGRYQPIGAARVSIEDRGLQFADGVYEVVKALGGRLCDLERHLDRLERSLAALRSRCRSRGRALRGIIREVLRRNALADAAVYLQVDRGVAPRNHLFPKHVRPIADRHRPPRHLPKAKELAEAAWRLSRCRTSGGSAATSSR